MQVEFSAILGCISTPLDITWGMQGEAGRLMASSTPAPTGVGAFGFEHSLLGTFIGELSDADLCVRPTHS